MTASYLRASRVPEGKPDFIDELWKWVQEQRHIAIEHVAAVKSSSVPLICDSPEVGN